MRSLLSLTALLVVFGFVAPGCGDSNNNNPADMAMTPPDMAATPADMLKTVRYSGYGRFTWSVHCVQAPAIATRTAGRGPRRISAVRSAA